MKLFCANTGRCGSLFFSGIFHSVTNIPSFHEPMPFCIGDTVEQVNNSDKLANAVTVELKKKIVQIKQDSVDGNYMESNQMFIKSYVDLVLDTFDDVYCVYLYRNPIEVVMSYYKKSTYQGELIDYHLLSHWKKNLLKTRQHLSFYDNILWECHEIKERYLFHKKHFKKTYEFDFRKINDPIEWNKMFRHFGIKVEPFRELPGVGKNQLTGDILQTLSGVIENWDKKGKRFFSIFPEAFNAQ